MVLQSYNEVYNNLYDYLYQTNAAELHLDQNYSYSEVYDMGMWINTQGHRHESPLNTT